MTALARLGRFAARRARLVVFIWLVGIVGAVGLAASSGARFTDSVTIPGSHSQQANDLLAAKFPELAGTTVQVVFHVPNGSVNDPSVARGIEATLSAIRTQPYVTQVSDPLSPQGGGVSRDATIAFSTVQYSAQYGDLGQPAVDRLQTAALAARNAGAEVDFGGMLIEWVNPIQGSAGEGAGLLAALIILVVAFGTLVAAAIPIATALMALAAGVPVIVALSSRVDISTMAPPIAAMLALGAGIDYALFISSRFREQLRAGHDVVDSIGNALSTSGRAVVFAGSTIVVSILALWLVGFPFMGWLGTAAAITVAVTVLAAMTLLPAVLGLIGTRIERFRVPGLGRARSNKDPKADAGAWNAWGTRVVSRPWPYLMASLGILLVLAAPVLGLRLGQPDAGSAATATTQRRAYDLLAKGFGPGINGPIILAVDLPAGGGRAILQTIESRTAADPNVLAVAPPQINATADTAVITVIPRTSPQSAETRQLLNRLQSTVLPAASGSSGAVAHLTGATAYYADWDAKFEFGLPIVIVGVIALSVLLLVLAFRSVVVALTAAALNLLSLGAAFGVVVAVFQWGWGIKLVGLDETVPIASAAPLMLFAILFGLSMDYEVFLLSRIHERYVAGADTRSAVVGGIASTARVITSAAMIMIFVFLSFVSVPNVSLKMFAVGLSTAVLVDATVVRVVLLPSVMAVLDKGNWWMPRWLDRLLPRLALEDTAVRQPG